MFQHKVTWFEEHFVEPLLNQMLEAARRNVNTVETVKVLSDDFAIEQFLAITPEILNQKGALYPVGARHFAREAQLTQNLMGMVNSGAYADPAVQAHISGLKIAELLEENLGLAEYELVSPNIRVAESKETQSATALSQDQNMQEIADRQMAEDVQAAELEA